MSNGVKKGVKSVMKNKFIVLVLSLVLSFNFIGVVYYRVVPNPPQVAHKVLIAPHGTPLIVVILGLVVRWRDSAPTARFR